MLGVEQGRELKLSVAPVTAGYLWGGVERWPRQRQLLGVQRLNVGSKREYDDDVE